MTDLGEITFFLEMEINPSSNGIFVRQKKYANEILKKLNMENYKSVDTPLVQNQKLCKEDGTSKADESVYRSLGSLLYLTATRLGLMYASSLFSRFMNEPSEIYFKAVKRVLRFVKGSVDLGILFRRSENSIRTIQLVVQEVGNSCSINYKSRLHLCSSCCEPSNLAKENLEGYETGTM
ncbi:uncharacterized protein LOC116116392 [Pistacia vera]|uniref:uncharacterized protein LOC116116392 n=1 Tax=Pistacia vera TaxID=55513 RepID=UPI001262E7AF|nr:uncharacterized protein LOC116116392 [Pistacia vera]